jgi:hypothetical protein
MAEKPKVFGLSPKRFLGIVLIEAQSAFMNTVTSVSLALRNFQTYR